TAPRSGRSRSATHLASVDLPEPEAPTTPNSAPASTSRFTSRRACTGAADAASDAEAGNDLLTFSTVIKTAPKQLRAHRHTRRSGSPCVGRKGKVGQAVAVRP